MSSPRLSLLLTLALAACGKEPPRRDAGTVDAAEPGDAAEIVDEDLLVEGDAGEGPDLASADLKPTRDLAVGGPDLATPRRTVRIATYNCRCLLDQPLVRAKGIAAGLAALDVDAVALQEICETPGAGGADNFAAALVAELDAATGEKWEHRFTRTHLAWSKWDEGVGLIARKGAILSSGEKDLPQGTGPFPRKALWAKVGTPGGPVFLYAVHLIAGDAYWTVRVDQVKAVLALVAQQRVAGVPDVVAGDFNDKDWSGPIQAMIGGTPKFSDAWAVVHPGQPGNTIPSTLPTERIDYVFVDAFSGIDRAEVIFGEPYNGLWLSDHRGVMAEFRP